MQSGILEWTQNRYLPYPLIQTVKKGINSSEWTGFSQQELTVENDLVYYVKRPFIPRLVFFTCMVVLKLASFKNIRPRYCYSCMSTNVSPTFTAATPKTSWFFAFKKTPHTLSEKMIFSYFKGNSFEWEINYWNHSKTTQMIPTQTSPTQRNPNQRSCPVILGIFRRSVGIRYHHVRGLNSTAWKTLDLNSFGLFLPSNQFQLIKDQI